jgi:hypothetical protein
VAGGEQYPHLADAAAVERWADERVEARSDFPRLLRRLIVQTNDQVTAVDMRAGGGTDYAGYDGEVDAVKTTPFVPAGASVWELGVGESPKSKADEDYEKRTMDSLGIEKSTTTFVFATARRWAGKKNWADDKRAGGHWGDVKAFDADDVETAFESAPAAHFWFSELVGLPVQGVRMIESWWDSFSRGTQPNLTPELALAGRADEAAQLLRILDEDTRVTTIAAASTDDVLAFVAATLLSTPDPERTDLLARTLIVHEAAALRRLDVTTDLLVLLPFDDELRREAQLVQSHHVILLAPQNVPAEINLPPIHRDAFATALRDAGLDEATATTLARAAHRSLVAFQAEVPSRGAPPRAWSKAFESKIVRRAWLAGAWQEARSGDTDALALSFGLAYEDARSEIAPLATGEDPIFATVGGGWTLISIEEAWRFALPHLTPQDLATVETLMQTVLGAVDPALELPVEDRWMASIHGKTRIHSSDLRKGLATTLAACGALGAGTQIGAAGTAADWAGSVVAQLLRRANEDATGDLWASLTDVLPLLAEAAPDVFLRAVQEGVRERSKPLLTKMFLDAEGDAFSVNSPHTGLLWALEGLAWSTEHAPLAVKLLGRLAEIDPGGRLSNRPLASLVDIFRAWLPQTSLPLDRRIAVLHTLRRDHPGIAWKLMLELLPAHYGVGSYTHSPQFRAWKPEKEGVTYGERWEFESAVAQALIEDASSEPRRWLDIVEHLARLPPPERASAVEHLRDLARSDEPIQQDRESIWNALDKMVRHHRSFPEADWSLPDEELDGIAGVAEVFTPSDPIRSQAWLFDEHLPDVGEARADYHGQEARVQERRAAAVADVIAAQGIDGLLLLAAEVEFPGAVGSTAARDPSGELDERALALIDNDGPKRASFAAGYVFQRAKGAGMAWVDEAIAKVTGRPLAQARLLQQVDDDLPAVWQRGTDLGDEVEKAYWAEFATWGRGDFQLVDEAATNLLQFDRPLAALDLMALYVNKDDRRVSPDLIVEGLQQLVRLTKDHPEPQRLSAYELESLLDYLRTSDTDEEQLGILEWQLLPALGFDARSPVLERRLARDPAFFVEILSLVYRPRGDGREGADVPEHVASNAYRLLDEWQILPGSSDRMGEVDAEELNEWVETARDRAGEVGRGEIADVQIGKVLAHARGDDDDTWPTKPVRDLIERISNSELEDGFGTEVYNSRGPTSRGLLDGGSQERELVTKYDDLATRVRDGWPRTAAVLSSLARGYEREARRHDEEAERFRQGMER